MQARFLLGPAGSGKTRRCLDEIRAELRNSPEGVPLLLLAPKQATFQLERQLLADPSVPGYTRLQILSFDRLATFILKNVASAGPTGGEATGPAGAGRTDPEALLGEQGRVMVLRAILAEKQPELEVFRSVARLPGFAQELSSLLRELQQHQTSPERLARLAEKVPAQTARKLRDLAVIMHAYAAWLTKNNLTDGDRLLELATGALRDQARVSAGSVVSGQWSVVSGLSPESTDAGQRPKASNHPQRTTDHGPRTTNPFHLAGLWLDGFAEMTPAELDLLAALIPLCETATLSFCLESEPHEDPRWLSNWSIVARTFRSCHQRLAGLDGLRTSVEVLPRVTAKGRFAGSPVLEHLERRWSEPRAWTGAGLEGSIRTVICANPDAEATLAAHEILRHVRAGGRYRDCAVLLRSLAGYDRSLRRVFDRFEIPFFLDRREPVAHHPLAELTRHALRTVAFDWRLDDWFGALKTGLVPAAETGIDRLENEALARGWEGSTWSRPLRIPEDPGLESSLERLRLAVTPPFHDLGLRLAQLQFRPTGAQLAAALRELWRQLEVERRLDDWCGPQDRPASAGERSSAIHSTVWDQMVDWLEGLELAFPEHALPLREWLPILDAGLSGLTVGVVPPALDQVLIGAVDRSRNPELRLVIVPGLNESVFPEPPQAATLLTDDDRAQIEKAGSSIGLSTRLRLGHERYLGYIAFTRARERLILSCARFDTQGRRLNPSPFLADVTRLFPDLSLEEFAPARDWRESIHPSELIAPLLRMGRRHPTLPALSNIRKWPRISVAVEQLAAVSPAARDEALSASLAERLYGPALRTSVTRIEKFAECPFRFLVNSGLRARERVRFEVDHRQTGRFQHEVLKRFHDQLRLEGRRWREVPPGIARERVRIIAGELQRTFGDGILEATESSRFVAGTLTLALQDFVEVIISWMNGQYEFNPVAAELKFGPGGDLPGWEIGLSGGRRLVFTGVIDRVDLLTTPDSSEGLVLVVDYKSSQKKIDERLLENGVQLQLPAYLSVLRNVPESRQVLGIDRCEPVGIFYVSLAGHHQRGAHRDEVLSGGDEARRAAYRHHGRFDARALPHLDNRPRVENEQKVGDQFNFTLTKKGELHRGKSDPMSGADFRGMLDQVEGRLRDAGERIFAGAAAVDPYRHGANTPCQFCEYRPVCRIDPWTHPYRALRDAGKAQA